MQNEPTSDVPRICREFIALAVHGLSVPHPHENAAIPAYLADLNRCGGFALQLAGLQNDFDIAYAALILAALAAEHNEIRRLSLKGLIYSNRANVDDIFVASGFDLDERVRRLALEGMIERRSAKLGTLCELLTFDENLELAHAAVRAKSGEAIPFFELEAPS